MTSAPSSAHSAARCSRSSIGSRRLTLARPPDSGGGRVAHDRCGDPPTSPVRTFPSERNSPKPTRRSDEMPTRSGSAVWKGDLQGGEGNLTVGDGVFEGAYSFKSRFEDGEGTNPEELIAAAHSACFAMALSHTLAQNGHTPESVEAHARVMLKEVDGAPTLARIDLKVDGKVPGIDDDEFQRFAEQAKK